MAPHTPHLELLADILGVNRILSGLDEIRELGSLSIHNACYRKGRPSCAWDSSEIALPSAELQTQGRPAVLIDVGGTHTKVGYQSSDGEITALFDHPNNWFKPEQLLEGPALEQFFQALIAAVQSSAPNLPPTCSIGLIWSNQVECVPIETPTTRGVSGIVRGIKTGGYRKGEWFLKGLRDGDDIGAILLRHLRRVGWNPAIFLLGNDTIFTLFAVPDSTAGVVMSSGGNCTQIGEEGREKGHIINIELGGHLQLPRELLSNGDRFFAEMRSVPGLALEELCAGTWFTQMVYAHICVAAILPEGQLLVPLRDALVSGEVALTNRELAALLRGELTDLPEILVGSREPFVLLLHALVNRAGVLSGVLAYLSVANQLSNAIRPITISLDSSMARHFSGLFVALRQTLQELCSDVNVEVSIQLVQPVQLADGGELSVPMLGMANALNLFEPETNPQR